MDLNTYIPLNNIFLYPSLLLISRPQILYHTAYICVLPGFSYQVLCTLQTTYNITFDILDETIILLVEYICPNMGIYYRFKRHLHHCRSLSQVKDLFCLELFAKVLLGLLVSPAGPCVLCRSCILGKLSIFQTCPSGK
jgi:hypothetical protein